MLPRMFYISINIDMHSMHFKHRYTQTYRILEDVIQRNGHDIVKHTQDKDIQVPFLPTAL